MELIPFNEYLANLKKSFVQNKEEYGLMTLRCNYHSLRILSIGIVMSMFCHLSSKVATNLKEEANQNGYKASNLNLNLLRDYQKLKK